MEFLQMGGPQRLPVAHTTDIAPVPVAVALLKGPLVSRQRMADGREQREQLGRPAVLHRCATQQPGGTQARVARQAEEGLGSGTAEVLGVMGLIGNQHRAGRGEVCRQARPAQQRDLQLQCRGLLAPVAVQPGRSDHRDPAVRCPHHRPRGHQDGEGLAQAHGIGENGTAPGQQPAHRCPLVGKQPTAVRQRLIQSSQLHQLAVRRQRRQRLLQPGEPAAQIRGLGEAMAETPLQLSGRFQGKVPAATPGMPDTPGPDLSQLGLGDRIEGEDELNAAGGAQTHQTSAGMVRGSAAGQRDRTDQQAAPQQPTGTALNLTGLRQGATDAINPAKCILRHIDNPGTTGRLLPTEPIGCTPGMRFSLRICAPNFVFAAGDNLSIVLLTRPAFTVASHPNPLITSCRKAAAA